MMRRRQLLVTTALLATLRPAAATPENLQAALRNFTGGAPVREGRVRLDIAPLVENGNAVPVSVAVDDAAPGSVRRLAIFTERNPQPEVAVFELGALAGAARVDTRMRLATSQQVLALAQLADGSFWQQRVAVVVTLAACVEGG
jgi:sulfur-oxidizing protein SoxY